MSWVCSNCSSTNTDYLSICTVCGAIRPAIEDMFEEEIPENKSTIVYSDAAVLKVKTKNYFKGIASIPKKVKKLFKCRKKKTSGEIIVSEETSESKISKKIKEKKIKVKMAKPWPEHKIKFDEDAIKAKGYISSVQKNINGVKGYEFIRSNGTRQFIRVEMILVQKLAKKTD